MNKSNGVEEVVFRSVKFKQSLESLEQLMVRYEFGAIEWDEELPTVDWGFALLYASSITSVQTERAQSAVLRVAISCLLDDNTSSLHKAAAIALLERCGNHMAVELALSRKRIKPDDPQALPAALRLEMIRNRVDYSVRLSNGRSLAVNQFQQKFWKAMACNDWLSISASTSAGKSRIVREYFADLARQKERFTLVYLVPTRALIEEVSSAPTGIAIRCRSFYYALGSGSWVVLKDCFGRYAGAASFGVRALAIAQG